jgi:dynein heavy chain
MNSVMDDSRLLTLPSNERIRLLPHMKMIFEIRDLKYATPVSWACDEFRLSRRLS